jgi:hypothetical protein
MAFVGDSRYLEDGGSDLQKLWEIWKWSEIKNCPGRYVTKSNPQATEISPTVLLHSLDINCSLNEYLIEGKDLIAISHFDGGGGLLTYLKSDGRFVHTLNTESGLLRKMKALGLLEIVNMTEVVILGESVGT